MRKKVTFYIDEQAEKERHVFWDMQGNRFDPMEDGEREISYRSLTIVNLYKISGSGLDGWCEKAGINARRSKTAQDQWTVSKSDIKRLNRLGVRFTHNEKST